MASAVVDMEFQASSKNFDSKTIIDAVKSNDLNVLKALLPTFDDNIQDELGHNLLHIAILRKHRETFDYLLSVGADVNAKCSYDDTAIILAMRAFQYNQNQELGDHFLAELIRKGADVDVVNKHVYQSPKTLLRAVLDRRYYQTAKLLIPGEKDLDSIYNETTVLEEVIVSDMKLNEKVELVSMLIYYGATVTDNCLKFASSAELLESLYDYRFDDENSDDDDFVVTLTQLFYYLIILFQKTEDFPRILHKITHIEIQPHFHHEWNGIFSIKPEYLQWLVDKFPLETKEIFNVHSAFRISCIGRINWKSIEILLESSVRDAFLSQFNKCALIGYSNKNDIEKFLMCLLSYGFNLHVDWLQRIYYGGGYSDLFKNLLMFFSFENHSFSCTIEDVLFLSICNVTTDITEIIKHARRHSLCGVAKFLPYCSRPDFIQYCKDAGVATQKSINLLPSVPTLKELARDASRSCIVKGYNVENCGQFYYVLKRLPLPEYVKKVISLETPLYDL